MNYGPGRAEKFRGFNISNFDMSVVCVVPITDIFVKRGTRQRMWQAAQLTARKHTAPADVPKKNSRLWSVFAKR